MMASPASSVGAALLGASLLSVTTPLSAQDSTSFAPACRSAEHRQFDFWIGEWEVTVAGNPAGRNTIVRVSGGCALLENWTATNGGEGKSLNSYDAVLGEWTQHWVGQNGRILHLTGGLRDGKMVLEGVQAWASGPLRNRITWTPVSPNEVRQVWEQSTDGGTTWKTAFDGRYVRPRE